MIDTNELTELLQEAGRRHHEAFITSDGADPEWPKWYAGYLQARIWDRFGTVPTQSELVYALVAAEKAHAAARTDEPWPVYYARFFLDHFGGA